MPWPATQLIPARGSAPGHVHRIGSGPWSLASTCTGWTVKQEDQFRIPAFDLDSVCGGGPTASPHLYDQSVDGGPTTLALFHLLGQPPATLTSLATRNMLRGLTMGLPSGQRVAGAMRLPELAHADLADLKDLQLHIRTQLWFYVLREAALMANGEHLGPVGAQIITGGGEDRAGRYCQYDRRDEYSGST